MKIQEIQRVSCCLAYLTEHASSASWILDKERNALHSSEPQVGIDRMDKVAKQLDKGQLCLESTLNECSPCIWQYDFFAVFITWVQITIAWPQMGWFTINKTILVHCGFSRFEGLQFVNLWPHTHMLCHILLNPLADHVFFSTLQEAMWTSWTVWVQHLALAHPDAA